MIPEGPRTRSRITAPTQKTHTFIGKEYNGISTDPYRYTSVTATRQYLGESKEETMKDVVTHNYKARSAAGEIINSPMDRLQTFVTPPVPSRYHRCSVVEVLDKGVKCWRGQMWDGMWPMLETDLGSYLQPDMFAEIADEESRLKDEAVSKAHAHASSAEISALMVVGEGRKTIESIAAILMRAVRIIKAVKSLDIKFLRKEISFKELTDRYMEARYALRPLMYDVEGAVKAWQTAIPHLVERHTARGFTAKEFDFSDVIVLNFPDSSRREIRRDLHCSVGCRAGVLCDVELSKLSVWGVDTVFETALELIPFSFIVGWFFNIADTLASFTPKAGVRKLASWNTVTTVSSSTNTLVNITNTWPTQTIDNTFVWGGKKNLTFLRKQRFVNPSRAYLPHFNVNLDVLKLIDLAKIFKLLK